jgi:hypothetical protein
MAGEYRSSGGGSIRPLSRCATTPDDPEFSGGNIAYRTNTVVRCDPKTGKMIDNPAGEKLWARPEYRKGWEVKI